MRIFGLVEYMAIITIVVGIILSGWYAFHGDIVFHSDIARDFTLMDQMIVNRKIDLIGEGIRGLSGLYHGPAWLYLNLPAFIVGDGNPVVVGWWWVVLELLYLYAVFWVAKKVFSTEIALISLAIIASRIPLVSHQLFNPNGAFLIFPLFFYFVWKYYMEGGSKHLAWGTLLAGVMIQCEVMFGLPMFLSLIGLVMIKMFKKRIPGAQIFVLLLVLVPLSTYIVFDLRHNFSQVKAVVSYLAMEKTASFSFLDIIFNRIEALIVSVNLLARGGITSRAVYILVFWACLITGLIKGNKRGFFKVYVWMNLFFWTFSLFFPEPIKGYYFDFSSLNAIIIASQIILLRKEYLTTVILIPLFLINLFEAKVTAFKVDEFKGNVSSSWVFNKELGEVIIRDAPDDFSVFTLDTDIWGYSANYGVRYAAKVDKKTVNFSHKSPITYLVIAKNTIDHPLFDVRWWREDQIRIRKLPIKTWEYKEIFLIEKYELTPEEMLVPVDPLTMSINTTLR